MKFLPCELRQQLGVTVARALNVENSNIGTLNALADSVKQPFMQNAAKSGSEPFHDICGDPAARNREGRPSSLHCVGDVLAHAPRQLSGCIAFAAPIVRDLAEISPSRMIECHSI